MSDHTHAGDTASDLALRWDAAAVMLDPAASAADQLQACTEWQAACLAGLPPPAQGETWLPAGKALSPADAARCVLDLARTTRLVQAVDAALSRQLEQARAPVDVLYAGCGPLAPLVLACASRHAGRRWRVHLVDVHEESLRSACMLFDRAGLAHHLGEVIRADAAQLRLPAGLRPGLLVAEVMQRALAREPQVAVVANLYPQCAPGARLIPERIEVAAWLADAAAEMATDRPPRRHRLAPVLTLSIDTIPGIAQALARGDAWLPEQVLQAPRDLQGADALMLATRIDIDGVRRLDDYDSGLTYPHFEFGFGTVGPETRIAVRYRLRGDPGFAFRRLD